MVAPGGACVVAPGGGMCGCSRGCVQKCVSSCVIAPGGQFSKSHYGGVVHANRGGHAWLLWGGMCGCSGGQG